MAGAGAGGRARLRKLRAMERLRSEPRQRAAPIQPHDRQNQPPQPVHAHHAVDQPRYPADDLHPPRQPPDRVVRHRPELALVRAVQHLGLVRGHVHARRTVGAARLTAEAQVEALAHLGCRQPANQRAVDRVLQYASAPTRHVLLVPRGRIARAHESRALANRIGAALAHARAAVHRLGEVAVIVGEGVADARGARRGGAAQIPIQRRRIHHDAGVEQAIRVKQGLDLAEQRDRLGAVHRGK